MLHFADLMTPLGTAPSQLATHELTAAKAALLGIVEGVTEFLPISSTGHLILTEKLVDVGQHSATRDAADTYTIVIQAGAILAVAVLYWRRLRELLLGLVGKDTAGRRLLTAIVVAFVPAAIVGVAFEKPIKDRLFGIGPVIGAWIVGGIAILLFARALHRRGEQRGTRLEDITVRAALIIGLAQVLALWPGTSRALVTILAALAVGLSLPAAVEFSFLLGLLTLGAATAFDGLKHGKEMVDTYGTVNPAIGFVFAFVAGVVAVRWMVLYLQRHSVDVFAWYRLAIAGLALVLLLTGVI